MSVSLLYVDSFDDYTDVTQRWAGTTSEFTISKLIVRTGTQALRTNGTNSNARAQQNFTPRSTYLIGFAIYTNLPAGEFPLVQIYDGAAANPQISLTLDNSGTIRARTGGGAGTLLGTASTNLPANAWHYLEFKGKIDASTGTVDIWLDGTNILSLTGQNTKFTANNTAGTVQLAEVAVSYFDDLYILDPTAGGAFSGPLGDVKMLLNMPSGNGTTNNYTNVFGSWPTATAVPVGYTIKDSNNNIQRVQSISGSGTTGGSHPAWSTTGGATTTDNAGANQVVWVCVGTGSNPGSANWMAVSEIPPDDNESYVTDATPGDIDRYVFPAIAGSTVKAVAVNIRPEKDDAGTRTIRAACESGGTLADGGVDFALSLGTYAQCQQYFEVDPHTGVAWTVSGVNAAEFGVKTTN